VTAQDEVAASRQVDSANSKDGAVEESI